MPNLSDLAAPLGAPAVLALALEVPDPPDVCWCRGLEEETGVPLRTGEVLMETTFLTAKSGVVGPARIILTPMWVLSFLTATSSGNNVILCNLPIPVGLVFLTTPVT